MGACCPCFERKEPEYEFDTNSIVEMQHLSALIRHRAHELTEIIIQGPLNMQQLPDFIERRLLETMIAMAFTAIITILLPPEHREVSEPNRSSNNKQSSSKSTPEVNL